MTEARTRPGCPSTSDSIVRPTQTSNRTRNFEAESNSVTRQRADGRGEVVPTLISSEGQEALNLFTKLLPLRLDWDCTNLNVIFNDRSYSSRANPLLLIFPSIQMISGQNRWLTTHAFPLVSLSKCSIVLAIGYFNTFVKQVFDVLQ